jgi:hypothetical protein
VNYWYGPEFPSGFYVQWHKGYGSLVGPAGIPDSSIGHEETY